MKNENFFIIFFYYLKECKKNIFNQFEYLIEKKNKKKSYSENYNIYSGYEIEIIKLENTFDFKNLEKLNEKNILNTEILKKDINNYLNKRLNEINLEIENLENLKKKHNKVYKRDSQILDGQKEFIEFTLIRFYKINKAEDFENSIEEIIKYLLKTFKDIFYSSNKKDLLKIYNYLKKIENGQKFYTTENIK